MQLEEICNSLLDLLQRTGGRLEQHQTIYKYHSPLPCTVLVQAFTLFLLILFFFLTLYKVPVNLN